MVVFTAVTASAALTFFLTPSVSPFRLLEGLIRVPFDGSWAVCAAASAGAAVTLAAASVGAMAAARARARRRARTA